MNNWIDKTHFISKAMIQDDYRLSGYASTYGNTDRVGDVIESGAFTESIQTIQANGKNIPLLVNHDGTQVAGHISPQNLREDSKGLLFEANLNRNTQLGKDMYEATKAGDIQHVSVRFRAKEGGYSMTDGAVTFTNLDLLEISLAPVPANPQAVITQVKAMVEPKESIKPIMKDLDLTLMKSIILKRKLTNYQKLLEEIIQ